MTRPTGSCPPRYSRVRSGRLAQDFAPFQSAGAADDDLGSAGVEVVLFDAELRDLPHHSEANYVAGGHGAVEPLVKNKEGQCRL